MSSKFRTMASKVRPLAQAVRGGCRPESPRLACRAANTVRKAGSLIQEEWPGLKLKAQGAYQAWKGAVKSGDEFMTLCHRTGKLILFFGSPLVVLKVAYTEYSRCDETADASSKYEKTRATTLAILHYADPPLAELYEFLSGDSKAGDDHSMLKRVLREAEVIYQDGVEDSERPWDLAFKYTGASQRELLRREEEEKKKQQEDETCSVGKQQKPDEENEHLGVLALLMSLFQGDKTGDSDGESSREGNGTPGVVATSNVKGH